MGIEKTDEKEKGVVRGEMNWVARRVFGGEEEEQETENEGPAKRVFLFAWFLFCFLMFYFSFPISASVPFW